jgi:hypothetical protein
MCHGLIQAVNERQRASERSVKFTCLRPSFLRFALRVEPVLRGGWGRAFLRVLCPGLGPRSAGFPRVLVRFDLICNAQRRVSTRPSHAPASSRHVACTCSLIPIIPKPSVRAWLPVVGVGLRARSLCLLDPSPSPIFLSPNRARRVRKRRHWIAAESMRRRSSVNSEVAPSCDTTRVCLLVLPVKHPPPCPQKGKTLGR